MVAGEIHETQEQLLVQRVMEIGLEIIEGQARPARGPGEVLGLDGAAWVARGHGPDALAAACEVLDAERVVLPSTLAAPPLIDRVRGHTLAAFRRRVPARITLADLDGTLAEVD